jgi:hypothetical protein
MVDDADFEIPAPAPALTEKLKKLTGADVDRYRIALLDLSDPRGLRESPPDFQRPHSERHPDPGTIQRAAGLGTAHLALLCLLSATGFAFDRIAVCSAG